MNRGAARPSRRPVSQWEPMHLPGARRVGGRGYGARVPGVLTFLRVAPAITFASGVAGVVLVDLLSWRRTRPVRGGSFLARHDPLTGASHEEGTSRLTLLPGATGVAAVAWGISALDRTPALGALLAAGGSLVASSGLLARVTAIREDRSGLTIRFAARRPFVLPWAECRRLVPPRTPVGGWRVGGRSGSRTLMPSDLWGKERLLASIVAGAALRFDGRRWTGAASRDRLSG